MRLAIKVIFGILISLLLIVFVLISSVYFQFLNPSFYKSTFEKHNIWDSFPDTFSKSLLNDPNLDKEERLIYSMIAKNIDPKVIKNLFEENIFGILAYLHGTKDDFVLQLSGKDIGIPGAGDIYWTLSEANSRQIASFGSVIHGIADPVFYIWLTLFLVIVLLFFFYRKLDQKQSIKSGVGLILFNGILITALSLALRFMFYKIPQTFPEKQEPSQALLTILSPSLFVETTTLWTAVGVFLVFLWAALYIASKFFLPKSKRKA